jgi:uncharacterized membrane protein
MYQTINSCQNIFVRLTHIFFILVRINEIGMEVNFIRLKVTIIICEYSLYIGTLLFHYVFTHIVNNYSAKGTEIDATEKQICLTY